MLGYICYAGCIVLFIVSIGIVSSTSHKNEFGIDNRNTDDIAKKAGL